MTSITPRYVFRALDMNGEVIAQSRGRAGAFAKVLRALSEYRDSVARGSGYLYGNPQTLGSYEVDGVTCPLGASAAADAEFGVNHLDRVGVARAAQIQVEIAAEDEAQYLAQYEANLAAHTA